MPLRYQFEIKPAGIVRRRAHGAVEIEFVVGALPRKLTQAAQGQLDVAGAEFDGVVEVAELAPIPHLDGAAVFALLLADAHALGVVAVGAERRGAGGADPFAAALMPRLLLRQALAQGFHQLFPAAERFDELLFLLGQQPLGEFFKPLFGDFDLGIG